MTDNRNALKLAVLTVVIYIAAATVGQRLFFYLSYVLGAVLIASFIWTRLNRNGLQVRREVTPTQAQVGQPIRETIELRNSSWIRKLWLEVRDQSTLPGHHIGAVVSLPGHKAKRWQVRTRCIHRGLFRLGPTVVITGDPFGLFQSGQVLEGRGEVLVFPPTVPLSNFGLVGGDLPGGSRTERRSYNSSPSVVSIRQYAPGDPVNRIHWPVSASKQTLMVKEFELDPTADLWIVVDLEEAVHVSELEGEEPAPDRGVPLRPSLRAGNLTTEEPGVANESLMLDPSTEEYTITVAASLASHFLAEGRTVGLIAWGQHRVTIPADRGGRQLIKILRALAILRAHGTTPLAEVLTAESRQFSRQDTVLVVTPSLNSDWVAALRVQLLKSAGAAAILVEPASFGGEVAIQPLVNTLGIINVPTYIVRRDDSIDAALSQQFGPAMARNLR